MCYTNYDEWDYSKWLKNVEDMIVDQKQQQQFGLKLWIEKLNNKKVKDDLKRLSSQSYDGKSGNLYEDIILTAWAQAFSLDCYDVKNDVVIKGPKGEETLFNVAYRYGRILRKYFNGTVTMPLSIPNCSGEDNEEPYYWIVIASALQKRYSIFSNLDDLNKFVFAIGRESVFSNYGFYMRDLTHVCLAYAIMHGYSIDEEKRLLQRVIKAVENAHCEVSCEERAAENTYTEKARSAFSEWFKIDADQVKSFKSRDDNENKFIQALVNNSGYILTDINSYNHWSALKTVLNTIFEANESEEDADEFAKEFNDRLLSLYDEVVGLKEIDIWSLCEHLKENSLQESIIKSLGIDKIVDTDKEYLKTMDSKVKKAVKNEKKKIKIDSIDSTKIAEFQTENMYEIEIKEKDAKDIIADSLRYIYIVALMKQIKNKDNCETTMTAIEYINKKLAEGGMREIEDYTKIGNNAIPVDMPKDFFDGFVVGSICSEQKNGFDVISGFDTFMQYVLKGI